MRCTSALRATSTWQGEGVSRATAKHTAAVCLKHTVKVAVVDSWTHAMQVLITCMVLSALR